MINVRSIIFLILASSSILSSLDSNSHRFGFQLLQLRSFNLILRGGIDNVLMANGGVADSPNEAQIVGPQKNSSADLVAYSLESLDRSLPYDSSVLDNADLSPLNASDERVLLRLQLRVAQVHVAHCRFHPSVAQRLLSRPKFCGFAANCRQSKIRKGFISQRVSNLNSQNLCWLGGRDITAHHTG